MRIGLGVDHHQIIENKLNNSDMPFTLGGLIIDEGKISLRGNSDADVILHALCNALSTALGGGSLGSVTDPMCLERGIKESRHYVTYFLEEVQKKGYKVGNVSVSVEAKRPRLEKYRVAITESIAEILGIERDRIGVAFTSGEGLSDCGRGLGIVAQVAVLLEEVS